LRAASLEVRSVTRWYTARDPEVAVRFRVEVRDAFSRIRATPRAYPLRGRHHHVLLHDFPFSVVYRIVAGEIAVVAIAHHRRKPRYWMHR
jgi:toxin ParE1/3/4